MIDPTTELLFVPVARENDDYYDKYKFESLAPSNIILEDDFFRIYPDIQRIDSRTFSSIIRRENRIEIRQARAYSLGKLICDPRKISRYHFYNHIYEELKSKDLDFMMPQIIEREIEYIRGDDYVKNIISSSLVIYACSKIYEDEIYVSIQQMEFWRILHGIEIQEENF